MKSFKASFRACGENLASGHGPGEGGHALHKCSGSAELSSQRAPTPYPLLRAGAGPGSLDGGLSTGPRPRSGLELRLPPRGATALQPPALFMAQPNLSPREWAVRQLLCSEPQGSHFSHQKAETPRGGDKQQTGTGWCHGAPTLACLGRGAALHLQDDKGLVGAAVNELLCLLQHLQGRESRGEASGQRLRL